MIKRVIPPLVLSAILVFLCNIPMTNSIRLISLSLLVEFSVYYMTYIRFGSLPFSVAKDRFKIIFWKTLLMFVLLVIMSILFIYMSQDKLFNRYFYSHQVVIFYTIVYVLSLNNVPIKDGGKGNEEKRTRNYRRDL